MAKKSLTSKRSLQKKIKTEEQEKALQKMRRGEQTKQTKERGKYYGRVTVDFPHEIYEEMKEYANEEGRTLKGYIVSLVKKDLKNK